MEMTAVWAAVLITYGFFPGIAMQPSGSGANEVLPLDLAPNSVDDMYDGCKDQMSNVVKEKLENEKNTNSNFKKAWEQGEEYYNKRWKGSPMLGKEQIVAVYTYTSASGDIYKEFNAAIRSQGSEYKTAFKYHALHFYLTDAIKTLNAQERLLQNTCNSKPVYRRVDRYFSQDVVNSKIRFGSFASTSMRGYINPEQFGEKSCFEILTCLGADVSFFSKFGDAEGEVLIPPYEVFKVTEVNTRSKNKQLPCEVVYKLKSTKIPLSNLNCALSPK